MMDAEIVKGYHGLRILQKKRFNLANVSIREPAVFADLAEARAYFERLFDGYSPAGVNGEFIQAKLNATIHYLRACLGMQIDFTAFIENTLGITPVVFDDLDKLRCDIEACLDELGIRFDQQAVERLNALDPVELNEETVRRDFDRYLSRAETYLGVKMSKPFRIEPLGEDLPYEYNLGFGETEYVLKIKRTPRRISREAYTYMLMHELCGHALQLDYWMTEVRQGRLSEVCACEEDNNPEIFQLEGVGEIIFYFVFQGEIDAALRAALLLDELRHKVENNCFLALHSGSPMEQILASYREQFIWGNTAAIEIRLRLSQDDPFFRTNLFVYAPCLDYFKQVSQALNPAGKREFFQAMYRIPMTFTQIDGYYKKLCRQDHMTRS